VNNGRGEGRQKGGLSALYNQAIQEGTAIVKESKPKRISETTDGELCCLMSLYGFDEDHEKFKRYHRMCNAESISAEDRKWAVQVFEDNGIGWCRDDNGFFTTCDENGDCIS